MSTGVETAIGRFVWHEINSTDPAKAKEFYTQLFGWQTETWKPGEMDYDMIKVGDQTHGGFGFPPEGGAPSHLIGHVLVRDVDDTVSKAEAAGGRIVAGPTEVPEVGRFAIIADPQGATLSAYTPSGEPPQPEGVFVWDELMTTDVDAAKSFYGEVFGWTSRDMDMGEGGMYTVFQRAGDVDVAGAMARPPGVEAPPSWTTYIGTEDVDGTVAKAAGLGATTIVEPMDIPNDVGRFAVLQDPTGAVFGLFRGGGS